LHGSKSQVVPSAQIDELAYQIGEDFLRLTTAHFSLLPGAEELVRYLAQKYPLVVLSNGFIEVQYDKINRSGLRDCFAHIVLSEEVGCQKPNPRIYETALQLCGMRAEEVLMIGDSWYSDIRGAINAGIDQLWITNRNTIADNQTATYIVENLQEIYDIV
jgi:putative hydrolase of the HAD superfamily